MNPKYAYLIVILHLLLGRQALGSMPTWVGLEIRSFAQTRESPEIIYATDSVGLFKSTDRGRTWKPLRTPKGVGHRKVILVPGNCNHLILWGAGFYTAALTEYQESTDGGKTWITKSLAIPLQSEGISSSTKLQLFDLVIDSLEDGGAWWFVAGEKLFRSTDMGMTWKISANESQKKILIIHAENWTLRLSGENLFRSSDRGSTWEKLYSFPTSSNGEASYASDLLKLSGGQLLARVNGIWYRGQYDGGGIAAEIGGLASLPDQRKTDSNISRFGNSNWYCRIRQAERVLDALFAFCVWDNRSWPSSLTLYSSRDGGRTWIKPSNNQNARHPDLPSWSPIAIWMDQENTNAIIMSWMAGGVYRSEDGGVSWQRSDQGLRYRTSKSEMGYMLMYEPPLIQAVMERDKQAIEKLIAEGVEINAEGNNVSGVLEADLITLSNNSNNDTNSSLYRYLRSKGAIPPSPHKSSKGFMHLACSLKLNDVIEDLIKTGYDWSYKQGADSGSKFSSELRECIKDFSKEGSSRSKKNLDKWIEQYIASGKFPSADNTVIDLFDAKRPDLALKVLRSASKIKAFDAQSTLPSKDRISIVPELWNLGHYSWAKRVFLSSALNKNSLTNSSFSQAILSLCKPEIAEWYFANGFSFTYLYCLGRSKISMKKRSNMLALMDSRGELKKSVWLELLSNEETRWVTNTEQYRRHGNAINELRGLIGVSYGQEGTKLIIIKVEDGYPAEQAGLKEGDEIVAIDDIPLSKQNLELLASKIRGTPGTTVTLRIKREGKEKQFTLLRKRWPHDF